MPSSVSLHYPTDKMQSNLIPQQQGESKRDRKRRETVNKIEMLHNGSWLNRDE